jgi:hypothetical protein
MKYSIGVALLSALCMAASLSAQTGLGGAELPAFSAEPALDTTFDLSASWDGRLSTQELGVISLSSPSFALVASLAFKNDGKYAPAQANLAEGNLGNLYFLLPAGGVAFSGAGFELRAGRLPHRDVVDSPYSLFVNGEAKTVMLTELSYNSEGFFYWSRWVELNSRSGMKTPAFPDGFPDRGANIKAYGLRYGEFSFGIQDAAVYVGRSFDLEYLLNPAPQYAVQYFRDTAGRPWATGADENDLLGFFGQWKGAMQSAQFQVLFDDFNLHFLLPKTPNNPWKAAWSLGWTIDTEIGKFSLWQAGATKYVFEPTYGKPGREYGYTYYPDSIFDYSKAFAGNYKAIDIADQMIGYSKGENNLALRGDWSGSPGGWPAWAYLEFTLSGSKSPTNAWQEDSWHRNQGTVLLGEAVLEKKLLTGFKLSKRFGALACYASATIGYAWNALVLGPVTPLLDNPIAPENDLAPYNAIWIWKPSSTNKALFSLTLGGSWKLDLGGGRS